MTLTADLLAALRADDAAHHLHPFTHHPQMHASGTHVIVGGDGCYVIDQAGRRLFDGIAGLWCVNVGYSCTPIVDAVTEQMRKLPYYCSFFNSTTQPAIELAGVLGRLAPPGLGQVFFVNSGSEANETALKLVRAYWSPGASPTAWR
jgi:putrescine---pyruvate transaminase